MVFPMFIVFRLCTALKGGSGEPVQFVLGGSDYSELQKWGEILKQAAEDSPMMEGTDIITLRKRQSYWLL